jgi:glycosyltransferase involved in cell wall biosynthesis
VIQEIEMGMEVSVVIPTRDRAAMIGETIESIRAQTRPVTEIIVVDDGSTDDTEAVVRRFGTPVRYHRIEQSVGPGAARNIGVSLAAGSWIAFCDSDDLWLPTKHERQLRVHALAPSVEFSLTDFVRVVGGLWGQRSAFTGVPVEFWEADRRELGDKIWIYETVLYDRFLRFNPTSMSTLLISKRRWELVGGFTELPALLFSEDIEFGLRHASLPHIGILADAQVGIRMHAGNRSRDQVHAWLTQAMALEYALRTHPAAKPLAGIFLKEIRRRRALAAGRAFAEGRLEVVRDLAPFVGSGQRDWKLAVKIAVARLPMPVAKVMQRALVAANKRIAGVS